MAALPKRVCEADFRDERLDLDAGRLKRATEFVLIRLASRTIPPFPLGRVRWLALQLFIRTLDRCVMTCGLAAERLAEVRSVIKATFS